VAAQVQYERLELELDVVGLLDPEPLCGSPPHVRLQHVDLALKQ
jgi:hypothetical protein